MNELKIIEETGLIKVYETDKGEKVVQAKELHKGLESNTKFYDWIKRRIEECDAIDGEDFNSFLSQSNGGRPSTEYILTLDTAKEMAMLERNEKGKEYRRYLIEVEKRFKQVQIDVSNLSPELQMFNSIFKSLAQVELSNREVKQEIQDMRDVISLDSRSWRKDGHTLIIKSAQKLGGNQYIEQLTKEVYKLIDARFGVNLNQRLTNKRRRMAEEGICKSKRDKLNKMDIIAEDKKLIEGYIAITKEMAIKYGAA